MNPIYKKELKVNTHFLKCFPDVAPGYLYVVNIHILIERASNFLNKNKMFWKVPKMFTFIKKLKFI
jgi:hypothetical protein